MSVGIEMHFNFTYIGINIELYIFNAFFYTNRRNNKYLPFSRTRERIILKIIIFFPFFFNQVNFKKIEKSTVIVFNIFIVLFIV